MSRVTAAALLVTGLAALASGCAQAPLAHTCSLTDKEFIQKAQFRVDTLGVWAQEYMQGDAAAAEVVDQARGAASTMSSTSPQDPTLRQAKTLLHGMFTEYGRAIQATARHRDAGPHIYRAYGLANFAHTVLTKAEPDLRARGCDVGVLL